MKSSILDTTAPYALLGVLLFSGACSSSRGAIERAQAHESRGNLYLAFHELESAGAGTSDDTDLFNEYWRVRPLYLLERGRELLFEEEEAQAIQHFSRVLAIDPENTAAKRWIARGKLKLAREATQRGDILRFKGQLEEAQKQYSEALRHVPGFVDAEKGKQIVNSFFEQRRSKAAHHVREGNHNLDEQRTSRARQDGEVAKDQDPASPGVSRLVSESERNLAASRLRSAEMAKSLGNYGAALRSYRQANELDPDPEVEASIAVMEREVEAFKLKSQATMALARALDDPLTPEDEVGINLDKADELLLQAFNLSEFEQGGINELMALVGDRRLDAAYTRATNVERLGRPLAALELFKELDAQVRDGYRDVKARISSLEESIALAEESFAKGVAAEEAGDAAEALRQFKDANLYCRNYKGVRARIEALQIAQ